jgi:hypothetical protein
METQMTGTDQINRISWSLCALAALVGMAVLASAQWSMPLLLPDIHSSVFAFAPDFLTGGALVVLGLWVLNAMLFAVVFSDGHWRPVTRFVDIALTAMWAAAMVWLVIGPQIFQSLKTDSATKFWLTVLVAVVMVSLVPKIRRALKG